MTLSRSSSVNEQLRILMTEYNSVCYVQGHSRLHVRIQLMAFTWCTVHSPSCSRLIRRAVHSFSPRSSSVWPLIFSEIRRLSRFKVVSTCYGAGWAATFTGLCLKLWLKHVGTFSSHRPVVYLSGYTDTATSQLQCCHNFQTPRQRCVFLPEWSHGKQQCVTQVPPERL